MGKRRVAIKDLQYGVYQHQELGLCDRGRRRYHPFSFVLARRTIPLRPAGMLERRGAERETEGASILRRLRH
jgi:hypothetical protein